MGDASMDKASAFDPARAVETIRDRIRGAMLDIIPDEQWNGLIQAEMKAFMEDRVERYGPHYEQKERIVPAGFKRIVRDMLEEEAKVRIKAVLDGPEWQGRWRVEGGSGQEPSEAVQRFLTEKGPEIVVACMRDLMAASVQSMIQQMRRGM